MEKSKKTIIKVQTIIDAPIEHVWKCWTNPEDIVHWNYASDDWHTPKAENNLRVGGSFSYRMEAKDGSMGFDFCGIYDKVFINRQIDYTLGDDRKVSITFSFLNDKTQIVEFFEAEDVNTIELQRGGWQAILDNFKKYTEGSK